MSELRESQARRVCSCTRAHTPKRVVLTGGPGAGKTAVLELCRQYFCRHVVILPESASVLFGGGFPRGSGLLERAATQRAIYRVQRELEAIADAQDGAAIILCDRGTVDGVAYWPGPDSLFDAVGSSHAAELARYHAVIHLRVPQSRDYTHDNPVRIESATQAAAIDEAIALAWRDHPQRAVVDSQASFLDKAKAALALVRAQLPVCCA
jgi:predicted ATPase